MSPTDDLTSEASSVTTVIKRRLSRSIEQIISSFAGDLKHGCIQILLPSGAGFFLGSYPHELHCTIAIINWTAVWRIIIAGDIGFADGYVEGDWSTPDLTALLRLLARNAPSMNRAFTGSSIIRSIARLRHSLNSNTKRGSVRNIKAHYDLGNEFYRLWLDSRMIYSSGIFTDEANNLDKAQKEKIARVCTLLKLQGNEHVLEIGCGWGGLANYLAATGCAHVTGITLSQEQLSYTKEIPNEASAPQNVEFRLQDYRDVEGSFDRIVSIEMFEAVGEDYWDSYFSTIRRSLAPGGFAVLQLISIAEDRYEIYRRNTDFIQAYIFPGGFLPSKTAFRRAVERAGLVIDHSETFARSYAETLLEWRRRFHSNWAQIAELGFDERFKRVWNYYLEYCEAGFRESAIDVGIYRLIPSNSVVRPENRVEQLA